MGSLFFMIFIPKKTKYDKLQKNLILGSAVRGTKLNFGNYGLKAIEPGRITEKQIEVCNKLIKRRIKNIGKLWVRIFAHKPVTKLKNKTRMGKGKGKINYWMCDVKKNKILFEIQLDSTTTAKQVLKEASMKLPLHTKIIFLNN